MIKTKIYEIFSNLPDHRIQRNKRHLLTDIVVLSILAVLCGAESYDSIAEYGNIRIDFLRQILYLPNGIPSHDTINRVLSSIRPESFEKLFVQWANTLKEKGTFEDLIPIDGKTIRGSKDGFHQTSPAHIVSAWSNANGIVLGQLKVDCKTNEITAIPELIDMLEIKGCIVSIDAMGTQKSIAKKIIDSKADYILALKGNHAFMLEDAMALINHTSPNTEDQTIEKGHGRIETRKCEVYSNLDLLDEKDQWAGLESIIKVTAQREIKGKITSETRYYIGSLLDHAATYNTNIRFHWGIENKLHWVLDMIFREDEQRKRNKYAAQNFAIIRKIALNLLRKEDSKNMSLKTKRLKAGWSNEFLLKILTI